MKFKIPKEKLKKKKKSEKVVSNDKHILCVSVEMFTLNGL